MDWFVKRDSVVRKIWGKPDTVLFIFAGAAAEFALNRAVDWLFYTGRLPADPLGRLFSTVTYARRIVFSETSEAEEVIDRMADIHRAVEQSRASKIPDWAYRDVLYMLIDYSIRSYELLVRRLTIEEQAEVYNVFFRVGKRMGIENLPVGFADWKKDRQLHLNRDLEFSDYSRKLYQQYRIHLGLFRYIILRNAQGIIVPDVVKERLKLQDLKINRFFVSFYKLLARLKLDWLPKALILPRQYASQVRQLEVP